MVYFADQKVILVAEVTRNTGKRDKLTNGFNVDHNYYQTILCTCTHQRKRKFYTCATISELINKKSRFKNMFTRHLCIFKVQYSSTSKRIQIKCLFNHTCIIISKLCYLFYLKIYNLYLEIARKYFFLMCLDLISIFSFFFLFY